MIWHVIPIADTLEHQSIGTSCHCGVKEIHLENGNIIIVHSAYDGRQAIEWAYEILNIK